MIEVAERELSNRDDCAYHVETVVLALGYLASALVLRRSWVVPAGYLYGGETRELEAVLPALGGACCCLDPLLEFNGKGLGMGDWGINRRSSRGSSQVSVHHSIHFLRHWAFTSSTFS